MRLFWDRERSVPPLIRAEISNPLEAPSLAPHALAPRDVLPTPGHLPLFAIPAWFSKCITSILIVSFFIDPFAIILQAPLVAALAQAQEPPAETTGIELCRNLTISANGLPSYSDGKELYSKYQERKTEELKKKYTTELTTQYQSYCTIPQTRAACMAEASAKAVRDAAVKAQNEAKADTDAKVQRDELCKPEAAKGCGSAQLMVAEGSGDLLCTNRCVDKRCESAKPTVDSGANTGGTGSSMPPKPDVSVLMPPPGISVDDPKPIDGVGEVGKGVLDNFNNPTTETDSPAAKGDSLWDRFIDRYLTPDTGSKDFSTEDAQRAYDPATVSSLGSEGILTGTGNSGSENAPLPYNQTPGQSESTFGNVSGQNWGDSDSSWWDRTWGGAKEYASNMWESAKGAVADAWNDATYAASDWIGSHLPGAQENPFEGIDYDGAPGTQIQPATDFGDLERQISELPDPNSATTRVDPNFRSQIYQDSVRDMFRANPPTDLTAAPAQVRDFVEEAAIAADDAADAWLMAGDNATPELRDKAFDAWQKYESALNTQSALLNDPLDRRFAGINALDGSLHRLDAQVDALQDLQMAQNAQERLAALENYEAALGRQDGGLRDLVEQANRWAPDSPTTGTLVSGPLDRAIQNRAELVEQASSFQENTQDFLANDQYGREVARVLTDTSGTPEALATREALARSLASYYEARDAFADGRALSGIGPAWEATKDFFGFGNESGVEGTLIDRMALAHDRIGELTGVIEPSAESLSVLDHIQNGTWRDAISSTLHALDQPIANLKAEYGLNAYTTGLAAGLPGAMFDSAANAFGVPTTEQELNALFRTDFENNVVRAGDAALTALNATPLLPRGVGQLGETGTALTRYGDDIASPGVTADRLGRLAEARASAATSLDDAVARYGSNSAEAAAARDHLATIDSGISRVQARAGSQVVQGDDVAAGAGTSGAASAVDDIVRGGGAVDDTASVGGRGGQTTVPNRPGSSDAPGPIVPTGNTGLGTVDDGAPRSTPPQSTFGGNGYQSPIPSPRTSPFGTVSEAAPTMVAERTAFKPLWVVDDLGKPVFMPEATNPARVSPVEAAAVNRLNEVIGRTPPAETGSAAIARLQAAYERDLLAARNALRDVGLVSRPDGTIWRIGGIDANTSLVATARPSYTPGQPFYELTQPTGAGDIAPPTSPFTFSAANVPQPITPFTTQVLAPFVTAQTPEGDRVDVFVATPELGSNIDTALGRSLVAEHATPPPGKLYVYSLPQPGAVQAPPTLYTTDPISPVTSAQPGQSITRIAIDGDRLAPYRMSSRTPGPVLFSLPSNFAALPVVESAIAKAEADSRAQNTSRGASNVAAAALTPSRESNAVPALSRAAQLPKFTSGGLSAAQLSEALQKKIDAMNRVVHFSAYEDEKVYGQRALIKYREAQVLAQGALTAERNGNIVLRDQILDQAYAVAREGDVQLDRGAEIAAASYTESIKPNILKRDFAGTAVVPSSPDVGLASYLIGLAVQGVRARLGAPALNPEYRIEEYVGDFPIDAEPIEIQIGNNRISGLGRTDQEGTTVLYAPASSLPTPLSREPRIALGDPSGIPGFRAQAPDGTVGWQTIQGFYVQIPSSTALASKAPIQSSGQVLSLPLVALRTAVGMGALFTLFGLPGGEVLASSLAAIGNSSSGIEAVVAGVTPLLSSLAVVPSATVTAPERISAGIISNADIAQTTPQPLATPTQAPSPLRRILQRSALMLALLFPQIAVTPTNSVAKVPTSVSATYERAGVGAPPQGAVLEAEPYQVIVEASRAYERHLGLEVGILERSTAAKFNIECAGLQSCVNTSTKRKGIYEGSFQLSTREFNTYLRLATKNVATMKERGTISPEAYDRFVKALGEGEAMKKVKQDPRYHHVLNTWAGITLASGDEVLIRQRFPGNPTLQAAAHQGIQLFPSTMRRFLKSGSDVPVGLSERALRQNNLSGVTTVQEAVTKMADGSSGGYAKRISIGFAAVDAYNSKAPLSVASAGAPNNVSGTGITQSLDSLPSLSLLPQLPSKAIADVAREKSLAIKDRAFVSVALGSRQDAAPQSGGALAQALQAKLPPGSKVAAEGASVIATLPNGTTAELAQVKSAPAIPTKADARVKAREVLNELGIYTQKDLQTKLFQVYETATDRNIPKNFDFNYVGSALTRTTQGFDRVAGPTVALYEAMSRIAGFRPTITSAHRPGNIGSSRHHAALKGKQKITSGLPGHPNENFTWALDLNAPNGTAEAKIPLIVLANVAREALNAEILARTGKNNVIQLSVGASYKDTTRMVHIDTDMRNVQRAYHLTSGDAALRPYYASIALGEYFSDKTVQAAFSNSSIRSAATQYAFVGSDGSVVSQKFSPADLRLPQNMTIAEALGNAKAQIVADATAKPTQPPAVDENTPALPGETVNEPDTSRITSKIAGGLTIPQPVTPTSIARGDLPAPVIATEHSPFGIQATGESAPVKSRSIASVPAVESTNFAPGRAGMPQGPAAYKIGSGGLKGLTAPGVKTVFVGFLEDTSSVRSKGLYAGGYINPLLQGDDATKALQNKTARLIPGTSQTYREPVFFDYASPDALAYIDKQYEHWVRNANTNADGARGIVVDLDNCDTIGWRSCLIVLNRITEKNLTSGVQVLVFIKNPHLIHDEMRSVGVARGAEAFRHPAVVGAFIEEVASENKNVPSALKRLDALRKAAGASSKAILFAGGHNKNDTIKTVASEIRKGTIANAMVSVSGKKEYKAVTQVAWSPPEISGPKVAIKVSESTSSVTPAEVPVSQPAQPQPPQQPQLTRAQAIDQLRQNVATLQSDLAVGRAKVSEAEKRLEIEQERLTTGAAISKIKTNIDELRRVKSQADAAINSGNAAARGNLVRRAQEVSARLASNIQALSVLNRIPDSKIRTMQSSARSIVAAAAKSREAADSEELGAYRTQSATALKNLNVIEEAVFSVKKNNLFTNDKGAVASAEQALRSARKRLSALEKAESAARTSLANAQTAQSVTIVSKVDTVPDVIEESDTPVFVEQLPALELLQPFDESTSGPIEDTQNIDARIAEVQLKFENAVSRAGYGSLIVHGYAGRQNTPLPPATFENVRNEGSWGINRFYYRSAQYDAAKYELERARLELERARNIDLALNGDAISEEVVKKSNLVKSLELKLDEIIAFNEAEKEFYIQDYISKLSKPLSTIRSELASIESSLARIDNWERVDLLSPNVSLQDKVRISNALLYREVVRRISDTPDTYFVPDVPYSVPVSSAVPMYELPLPPDTYFVSDSPRVAAPRTPTISIARESVVPLFGRENTAINTWTNFGDSLTVSQAQIVQGIPVATSIPVAPHEFFDQDGAPLGPEFFLPFFAFAARRPESPVVENAPEIETSSDTAPAPELAAPQTIVEKIIEAGLANLVQLRDGVVHTIVYPIVGGYGFSQQQRLSLEGLDRVRFEDREGYGYIENDRVVFVELPAVNGKITLVGDAPTSYEAPPLTEPGFIGQHADGYIGWMSGGVLYTTLAGTVLEDLVPKSIEQARLVQQVVNSVVENESAPEFDPQQVVTTVVSPEMTDEQISAVISNVANDIRVVEETPLPVDAELVAYLVPELAATLPPQPNADDVDAFNADTLLEMRSIRASVAEQLERAQRAQAEVLARDPEGRSQAFFDVLGAVEKLQRYLSDLDGAILLYQNENYAHARAQLLLATNWLRAGYADLARYDASRGDLPAFAEIPPQTLAGGGMEPPAGGGPGSGSTGEASGGSGGSSQGNCTGGIRPYLCALGGILTLGLWGALSQLSDDSENEPPSRSQTTLKSPISAVPSTGALQAAGPGAQKSMTASAAWDALQKDPNAQTYPWKPVYINGKLDHLVHAQNPAVQWDPKQGALAGSQPDGVASTGPASAPGQSANGGAGGSQGRPGTQQSANTGVPQSGGTVSAPSSGFSAGAQSSPQSGLGGLGNFFSMIPSMLSALLAQLFGSPTPPEQAPLQMQPVQQPTTTPKIILNADPIMLDGEKTWRLSWSATSVASCTVYRPDNSVVADGDADGFVSVGRIAAVTEYRIVCRGAAGVSATKTLSVNPEANTRLSTDPIIVLPTAQPTVPTPEPEAPPVPPYVPESPTGNAPAQDPACTPQMDIDTYIKCVLKESGQ